MITTATKGKGMKVDALKELGISAEDFGMPKVK